MNLLQTRYPRHLVKLVLAYKGCFSVLTLFSGRVAGLVACWFKFGGVPVNPDRFGQFLEWVVSANLWGGPFRPIFGVSRFGLSL